MAIEEQNVLITKEERTSSGVRHPSFIPPWDEAKEQMKAA